MDYKLMLGDCLERMNEIPDGSVDMILCDLPYGTTACKWDSVIPFEALWHQYRRLISNNGVIALFGSEPFSTKLRSSNMEMYKYDWIWRKNTMTGFLHAKNMPMKNYEIISVFSKGGMGHRSVLGDRRMVYNPQGVTMINKEHGGGLRKTGGVFGKRPSQKEIYMQEGTGYPCAILDFDSVANRTHPTQKPVALLAYLIETHSFPGDLVLDNCMGSGSTGVACARTGRNFIGIEREPKYFESAKNWIEQEAAQMRLFD